MSTGFVKLESRIPEIAAAAEAKAELVVDKTAHDIQGGCQTRSRVDTGQMRDGWEMTPLGGLEAAVSNSVEHVIFNEFGTEHLSAQPMMTPSIEEAREPFISAIGACYE